MKRSKSSKSVSNESDTEQKVLYEKGSERQGTLIMQIIDTGIGISPETQTKIGQLSSRADASV